MAFDKAKDKELFGTQCEGLLISVHSYDGGEPKLQIGPRVSEGDNGEKKYRKAGRLSLKETALLFDSHEHILQAMEGTPKTVTKKKKASKAKKK